MEETENLLFSLQLFYRVMEEKARQSELYLVGMVCYYGKHYSTFFFQTKIRRWMYFDDAHVKEVYSLMPAMMQKYNPPYSRNGQPIFPK